ncbi:hypothetical protein KQI82_12105 [Oscillibacter sp. MSJ-2]|uniref:Uncharacterized protein n=1 Tax=Dysosmobacter acutus TaxID=2841504 RepID=A0ABS6FBK8_9FIRM|nr:hypothetical protein [Dysosmobacter acutus]MBU5627651.1 hypothetical protein [Dysosmobacter acutus]
MNGEQMRTFGYICPDCGKPVIGTRSVFALEASNAEVACECGASALRVENEGERFRVLVPCGICGETHQAFCRPEALLEGNGVGLGCTETGQLCCYIGPMERVEPALRELAVLVEKEREQKENPEAFLDNVIMYEVLCELKEIAKRPNGITCSCGSGRYSIEVRHAAVDLVCRDCGAKLRLPAATDEDLDRLCCHMKLQIRGK